MTGHVDTGVARGSKSREHMQIVGGCGCGSHAGVNSALRGCGGLLFRILYLRLLVQT
jgi:hypothetical protein